MSSFETNPKKLKNLLAQIDDREIALPDFQRSFVWDPNATEMLLESIASDYPAGSLLFIKHRNDLFAIREFEEAPPLAGVTPNVVVLDGQQRLTSLYQALSGKGDYRYFVAIEALFADDVEEAIFHESASRAAKRKLDHVETQVEALILPMERLFETNGFGKWRDEVLKRRSGDGLGDRLWEVHNRWLKTIEEYEFPVVTLHESTALEAVCNIFETLNSTGVRLSVFELLTARFWPHRIDLRGMWEEAKEHNQILEDFEINPYYLLQIVALRAGFSSCTRSSILKLQPDQMRKHWDIAVAGLAGALAFLKEECGVVRGRWLPYEPMVLPMGGIWVDHINGAVGPGQITRKDQIARWYWCSTFGQVYENNTNTRALQDYKALPVWLAGGDAPPAVKEFSFDQDLREVTHRQRALYRALLGLIVRRGARDIHNGERLTWDRVHDDQINDHHVFPQAYLRDHVANVTDKLRDSILNRALIDKITNIRVGKRAPSDYLQEIAEEIGDYRLDSILGSHLLPTGVDSPMRHDDFDSYLDARERALVKAMEEVTGMSGQGAPV